jgi:hypothetical protein
MMLAPTAPSAPPYSAWMRWPALGQIAGKGCDHQHGFKPLAEQDDGGLYECRGHEPTPVFGSFYPSKIPSKADLQHTTLSIGARQSESREKSDTFVPRRKLE